MKCIALAALIALSACGQPLVTSPPLITTAGVVMPTAVLSTTLETVPDPTPTASVVDETLPATILLYSAPASCGGSPMGRSEVEYLRPIARYGLESVQVTGDFLDQPVWVEQSDYLLTAAALAALPNVESC